MKILVIDDNPDNLTALKAVVTERMPEVEVLAALNGQRGLELARAEDPAVILLDIVMPGLDGYAVCRQLKADPQLQLIPVLFLTALRNDPDSRVKALEVGAEGFLSKPFDQLELFAQIRAMAKIKAAALAQRHNQEQLAGLVAERTRELQQSQRSMLNLLEDLQAENKARQKSEQALRESEEKFRLLFNSSRDAVLVHELTADHKPGRFIESNEEACRRYGYSHDELMALSPLDLVVPDGRQAMLAAMARLVADGDAKWEGMHVTRDGRKIPVEVVTVCFEYGGKILVMVTVRDITQRKQAADALARQLDELRRWQTVTLGREGRIGELKREVNALAAQLGQVPPYASREELERQDNV